MLDWILNTPLVKVVRTQIWNHKGVASPINWNVEKNTIRNTKGLKRGSKRINMKIVIPFHLAFPTSIYLFKIILKTERHCAKYAQS